MSAILNAIFGTYPEQQQESAESTTQSVVETSTANGRNLHTSAVSDDVQVKSVISSETQATATVNNPLDINALLAQLSTTHSQVDTYSRERTAEINEQVQRAIGDVLAGTQRQQEELLGDANRRHLLIDTDYKTQLQKAVEALDANKAKSLADLERDLHAKQQAIMSEAKRQIDALNEQANAAKLHVLKEAQEQARQDITHITDQVATVGQQETQHLLQSTTTTVITSHAQAAGITEAVVAAPVTETVVATNTAVDSHQQVVASTTALETQQPVVPSAAIADTQQHAVACCTNATDIQQPVALPLAITDTQSQVVAPNTGVETQQQVTTVSNVSEPATVALSAADTSAIIEKAQQHTNAFGTVTGASELTTTAAVPIGEVPTNNNVVTTEVKSPPDNTAF